MHRPKILISGLKYNVVAKHVPMNTRANDLDMLQPVGPTNYYLK